MLQDCIIATLRFFDLQDLALTLQELHDFLIRPAAEYHHLLNEHGDLTAVPENFPTGAVRIDEILSCLDQECAGLVEERYGLYFLPGRKALATKRLENYLYGLYREKRVKKYLPGVRHLPFVRGVALSGSQALGLPKASSDIDLFIITDPHFLWLTRTLVTAYFQVCGLRRHGTKIANRFCLNHYISGQKSITELKNLYTACEYLKLRPVAYPSVVAGFQRVNLPWIRAFFPNARTVDEESKPQSAWQKFLEKIFTNHFGAWLEQKLKSWQLPKIHQEKFIVVADDELSFHPDSKQQALLTRFLSL